jgi:hypothetical protein
MNVEISVIELVLRHAVQRGVLDADDVNAAVDRMWSARTAFLDSQGLKKRRGRWPRPWRSSTRYRQTLSAY